MIDNIFKSLFLIVLIALVCVLYNISTKMDSSIGRFQISDNTVIDTKTGNRYRWYEDEGYILLNTKGELSPLKAMPK